MTLLADLEKAKKERENDPGQATTDMKVDQKVMARDEKESTLSPVGSK